MNTSEEKARRDDSSREGSNERKNESVSELRHRWNSEDIWWCVRMWRKPGHPRVMVLAPIMFRSAD